MALGYNYGHIAVETCIVEAVVAECCGNIEL